MLDNELLAISYPLVLHPLSNERPQRKIAYISQIERLRQKYLPDDLIVKARLERFAYDLLGEESNPEKGDDSIDAMKELLRTHFVPFRFYSYRYIFLFDCIFLLAPRDHSLASYICEDVKNGVPQCYHERLEGVFFALFDANSPLPSKTKISKEVFDWWMKSQKYFVAHEKYVVFTAAFSAGKSTLINAVIGQKLSFTKQGACTATLIEFRSTPTYHNKYNIVCGEQFFPNLAPVRVREFSKNLQQPCCINGFFELSYNPFQLHMLDTPGIDSALHPEHKKLTRNALLNREYDTIVYIIKLETYGSDKDLIHLRFIKQHVSYRTIMFVVNMMDTFDPEDDDTNEIICNVSTHLENIGFPHPNVCPVSAKAGYLFKRALAGTALTESEIDELTSFYTKYNDPAYDLSGFYPKNHYEVVLRDNYLLNQIPREELLQAYYRTGLPQFEEQLMTD